MAADEQETQDIVAVVRLVELLGDASLGIVEIRQRALLRQRPYARVTAQPIERRVLADEDEPCGRIARWRKSAPTACGRAATSAASMEATSFIAARCPGRTAAAAGSRRSRASSTRARAPSPSRSPRRGTRTRRHRTRAAMLVDGGRSIACDSDADCGPNGSADAGPPLVCCARTSIAFQPFSGKICVPGHC